MLRDAHGRTIDYLRISVTDRCDLRCVYCMPPEGVPSIEHDDVLRFEEIEAVVRAGVGLGIKNVRLTGGEPLTRIGIATLIQKLRAVPGLNDLAMTTNGALFSQMGRSLREAGLARVNFGISSLDPDIYGNITRSGRLGDAQDGLDAAISLGFVPIKLNVVVMRGVNEDLTGFVTLAGDRPVHVRFIEYMPIGAADHLSLFVPASEIRQRISAIAELEPLDALKDMERLKITGGTSDRDARVSISAHRLAPARSITTLASNSVAGAIPAGHGPVQSVWRVPNGQGSIAIIAPLTEHVCGNCNRLRLTADGRLRPCLFSGDEIDLKPALRPALNIELLKSLLMEAVNKKPKSLRETRDFGRKMSQIGG